MGKTPNWALIAGAAVCVALVPTMSHAGAAAAHRAHYGHAARARTAAFYLKDGDRIVFYGDSITDQRMYTTYVESYCVTRFPNRHFTFVHSGWGGDRVTGGGGGPIDVRIDRDIKPYKPTVITICLGMNDGSYRAFDQGIFDTYVKGYRHILDRLKAELPHARVTLVTAPLYDDITRAPNFPGGYNETLKKYGEAVAALAKEYHHTLADTNAPLVDAVTRAKGKDADLAAKLIPDRVHPGPGGHMVMAAAILEAWHAPAEVAEITVDARRRSARGVNTTITDVADEAGGIKFTHLDRALPWPIDRDPDRNRDMLLALQSTSDESQLNRFTLRVSGLRPGRYMIKADGVDAGRVDAAELGSGVDLAALPSLPSNQQAREVLSLTRKHNDLHFQRWRNVQFPVSKKNEPVPADVKTKMDDLDRQDAEAAGAQREAAQPKPHVVEILPAS